MMDIIDPKSDCIRNNWHFIRKCHLYYINMHPGKFCRILNEYLFLMRKKYCLYHDRFVNAPANEITEYDCDHLITFRKIIYADILDQPYEPDDDFTQMLYFYTDLIKTADKILKRPFMYGDQLTLQQGINLIDDGVATADYIFLSQKNIIITIPKKYFNLECHTSKNNYPGNLVYTDDGDFVDIIFDNTAGRFGYVDIWNIKSSLRQSLYAFMDWDATSNNIFKIYFRDSIL